jgi:hypothetical protein
MINEIDFVYLSMYDVDLRVDAIKYLLYARAILFRSRSTGELTVGLISMMSEADRALVKVLSVFMDAITGEEYRVLFDVRATGSLANDRRRSIHTDRRRMR